MDSSFFGATDLKSGFYQVPMAEHSIEITAFSSTSGLHEFLVMPLGLSNAPSHFMTQVDGMLTEFDLRGSAEAFVDDITTHGKTVKVYAAK